MSRPVDVPTTLMQYDGQLTLIAEMRDRLTECADELQNLVARAEDVLRKNE